MIPVWTILCRSSSIDRNSNRLSLFDVVDELEISVSGASEGVIPAPVDLELVTLWRREHLTEPEELTYRIEIRGPGELRARSHTLEVDLTEFLRSRAVVKIPSIPVPLTSHGLETYWLVIQVEDGDGAWQQLSELPLDLTLRVLTDSPDSE